MIECFELVNREINCNFSLKLFFTGDCWLHDEEFQEVEEEFQQEFAPFLISCFYSVTYGTERGRLTHIFNSHWGEEEVEGGGSDQT